MSMPAASDKTTWSVTGQTEYTQVGATGPPVKGVLVAFTTGRGHSGSVFVPYSQYTAAHVRGVVANAAANMDAVGMLTSG